MKKIIVATACSLLLFGCSSEDSGSASSSNTVGGVTYSGSTSAAEISSANAVSLTGAVVSGPAQSAGNTPRLASVQQNNAASAALALIENANAIATQHVFKSVATGVVQNSSETLNGTALGAGGTGTATLESSIDDVTGLGSVTATYTDYGIPPNLINGSLSITVSARNAAGDPTSLSLEYNNLTIASSQGTSSIGGTFNVVSTTNSETITINLVAVEPNGNSFKLENYVVEFTYDDAGATLSESLSGRVFDSTVGFVDIATTNPLLYSPAGANNPTSGGPVIITGANNTKIKLTPLDATNITLEVDADGDDVYESSQTVAWSGL